MLIKKYYLLLSFAIISIVALAYGASPQWFAETWLGVAEPNLNFVHILRVVMCIYLGLGLFWLYGAFSDKYRNGALLSLIVFASGALLGRIISFALDGPPAPILTFYLILELGFVPLSIWVFRRPD